jgi:hypothetical protein
MGNFMILSAAKTLKSQMMTQKAFYRMSLWPNLKTILKIAAKGQRKTMKAYIMEVYRMLLPYQPACCYVSDTGYYHKCDFYVLQS